MITFRWNGASTVGAAYLGKCRVGYVQKRTKNGWLWYTDLLKPEGGHYSGGSFTLDAAQEQLRAAITEWIEAAGLELKKDESGVHAIHGV
jgi:hypothetical protein